MPAKQLEDLIQCTGRPQRLVLSEAKDTQMRDVIDQVALRELEPVFEDYFRVLQRGKHLEQYQFLLGYYLISLDGALSYYSAP